MGPSRGLLRAGQTVPPDAKGPDIVSIWRCAGRHPAVPSAVVPPPPVRPAGRPQSAGSQGPPKGGRTTTGPDVRGAHLGPIVRYPPSGGVGDGRHPSKPSLKGGGLLWGCAAGMHPLFPFRRAYARRRPKPEKTRVRTPEPSCCWYLYLLFHWVGGGG